MRSRTAQTRILCASYQQDPAVALPLLTLLPDVLHVPASRAGPDLDTTLRLLAHELAAQRLRDTDDTVSAIARSLGYTSEYAFNRAFTRHRRTPPGRYRSQARAAQAP